MARSRWWLDGLRQCVPWLRGCCLATVWQTLHRCHLVYKRGRRYVHSPDPLYAAKLATIGYVRQRAVADPERVVVLYEDEFTYHRRPTVGRGYALAGSDQPRAGQGWRADTTRRIAACLDVGTGQVHAQQRAHWPAPALTGFFQQVAGRYPAAQRIYIALDNWPVHFQQDLRATLAATTPIRLLRLPTYAPWTNPVEQLWRKLYAEVLHLHRLADAWDELTQTVQAWLDQWLTPAPDLLRYLGLLCPT
ncbi:MAG TPA: IS630 family transposase [Ktedonobacterales bacterium]|nr:IS630 family transposase [Ktedonobacterales bacterium]